MFFVVLGLFIFYVFLFYIVGDILCGGAGCCRPLTFISDKAFLLLVKMQSLEEVRLWDNSCQDDLSAVEKYALGLRDLLSNHAQGAQQEISFHQLNASLKSAFFEGVLLMMARLAMCAKYAMRPCLNESSLLLLRLKWHESNLMLYLLRSKLDVQRLGIEQVVQESGMNFDRAINMMVISVHEIRQYRASSQQQRPRHFASHWIQTCILNKIFDGGNPANPNIRAFKQELEEISASAYLAFPDPNNPLEP